MRYFVTGGAGFIGSNVVDHILKKGDEVTVYDNLSTGKRRFLSDALKNPKCKLVEGDILNTLTLTAAMKDSDLVIHLSANADVRFGTQHPYRDLEQNTIGTFNVLEAMRANGISKIAFSSTGSVYGEAKTIPTPEDAEFPIQTSLYGSSKLSGEGLIASYCEGFGFQSWIFRFVSILGERYTHGHVYDFYKRLKANPDELTVLGNGKQRKSYLYIGDCIDAIFLALDRAKEKVNIFNLGTDEYCQVLDSIGWITGHMKLEPHLKLGDGDRGWIGDNPFIFLDCSKIKALGWKAKHNIRESVLLTLTYMEQHPWIFDERI